jgi:hypothetical protein
MLLEQKRNQRLEPCGTRAWHCKHAAESWQIINTPFFSYRAAGGHKYKNTRHYSTSIQKYFMDLSIATVRKMGEILAVFGIFLHKNYASIHILVTSLDVTTWRVQYVPCSLPSLSGTIVLLDTSFSNTISVLFYTSTFIYSHSFPQFYNTR